MIAVTGQSIMGVRAADGGELWQHGWATSYDANIATPVVVGRDVLITLMRYFAIKKGGSLHTSRFGKWKTAFQMISIAIVMVIFIGLIEPTARLARKLLPTEVGPKPMDRPNHLDPSALATPSLAISNATREALHQADVVETMLAGVPA